MKAVVTLKEVRFRLSRLIPKRTQDKEYRGLSMAIDEVNKMIEEHTAGEVHAVNTNFNLIKQ